MRSFNSNDVNKLLKKDLAFFYFHCLDSNFKACVNLTWTMPWVIEILNTINPTYVCSSIQAGTYEDAWDQLGECGDYLASCLEIGDNFVVNVEEGNQEDVDFYVMLCTQLVHVVKEDFIDTWSTNLRVGDVVVVGTYYQTWGRGETSYVFLQNFPIVFLLVSHVKSIKFPMLPSSHMVSCNDVVYMLLNYSLCGIMQALVALDVDND
jgi:hypothetical protein